MYLLILVLPLLSSLFTGLYGIKLGFKGVSFLSVSCLYYTFFLSIFILYEVSFNNCFVYLKFFTWIDSECLNINWGFMFDSLTAIMCFIISFISLMVHIYSIEYMKHDPHLPRFMSYLSLFTFFMLILVSSDNFVQMFVGWEGVGLCSYLLINFWHTRIQANKAAIKAMVINRIGDFGLIIGIIFIFVNCKTVDYACVFALTPLLIKKTIIFFNFSINVLTLIGIFLFIGVIGKSAQIGLHTWLPDAMEGPTPVSALIHAATMVTAGVFLLARCSPIYEFVSFYFLNGILVIGSITCFFAASVGLVQNDLKKVIAYSTCSQLGYMIFVCGLSQYNIAIFHLINHAFFKALLFLGAGSVIHSVLDEQDLRKMGGLKTLLFFSYSVMTIGSLALIGFPFLTGYYSKDLILENAFGQYNFFSHFAYCLGTFSAMLTTFYSIRMLFLTFLSSPNGYKPVIENAKDSNYFICFVLSFLTFLSIFIGFFGKDILIGWGSYFFNTAIFISPKLIYTIDSEFIRLWYKLCPTFLSILILVFSFFFFIFFKKKIYIFKKIKVFKNIYLFLNKKWFFDKIYNEWIGQFFFTVSYSVSYKTVDRGVIELLGPSGLTFLLIKLSLSFSKFQTGMIYHYLLMFLVGTTIFLILRWFLLFVFPIVSFQFFILCLIILFFLNKSTHKTVWRI
jgi:NADH-ubiquinone oxidoreductase chain 5